MKNPKLIVKPFAKNGQKNVIPENYETSMDSNQATWDQGFGQITMLPVAAGGLPPKGQDFNGILNQISENIVYQSQGGRFKFSPESAESIGGYPKGAILQSDDEKKEYQSLIDNNKVNFNTTSNISASWELVGYKYAIKTEVDLALTKKFDKENISSILGNDNSKVPSLGLLTTEVGKLQPKGNYQPAGDYATKNELKTGLDGKLGTDAIVQSGGQTTTVAMSQKAVTDSLGKKLDTSSVVQSTGTSVTSVMSQNGITKALENKADSSIFIGKTASDNAAVTPAGGVTSFVFHKDGGFSLWDYTRTVFQVTKAGKVEIGDIPYSNVSGIPLVGIGQKWQDVSSQRQKLTTYTNTTGKPILVIIGGSDTRGNPVYATCDGVNVGYFSRQTVGVAMSITFLAPPGSSYQLGDFNFTFWSELR